MDSIKEIETEVDNKETVYYVKCELCGIKYKLLTKTDEKDNDFRFCPNCCRMITLVKI